MMTPIQQMMWAKQKELKQIQAKAAKEKKKKEQAAKRKDPLDVMKKHLNNGLSKWKSIEQNKLHTLCLGYERELDQIKNEIDKAKKSKALNVDERQKIYKQGSMTATHRMMTKNYTHVGEEQISYPPELINLMSNFINLPVSNARCERIFSHLKLVYSKRRYNLDQKTIHAIMFLKVNKLIPKKSQAFWDRQVSTTKKKTVTETKEK